MLQLFQTRLAGAYASYIATGAFTECAMKIKSNGHFQFRVQQTYNEFWFALRTYTGVLDLKSFRPTNASNVQIVRVTEVDQAACEFGGIEEEAATSNLRFSVQVATGTGTGSGAGSKPFQIICRLLDVGHLRSSWETKKWHVEQLTCFCPDVISNRVDTFLHAHPFFTKNDRKEVTYPALFDSGDKKAGLAGIILVCDEKDGTLLPRARRPKLYFQHLESVLLMDDNQEKESLKECFLKHGGTVAQSVTASTTHLFTNTWDGNISQISRQNPYLMIVRPEWVMHSINMQTLLDEENFEFTNILTCDPETPTAEDSVKSPIAT